MPRSDFSYPYPLLREHVEDFRSTFFQSKIAIESCIDEERKGFKISTHFDVNNPEIKTLLCQGSIKFALYIYCSSTFLRMLHFVESEDTYFIDSKTVHHKVVITPYIVASEDFEYYCSDFSEEFEDLHFQIHKGDLIGIGQNVSFDALFKQDRLPDLSSIVKVTLGEKIKYPQVKLDGPQITILLPSEQYFLYQNFKKAKDKHSLLNAIFTIPALVEAISTINNDYHSDSEYESEYEQFSWYMVLSHKIEQLASQDQTYEDLLERPTETAQRLMSKGSEKGNSEAALNSIDSLEE